MKRLSFLILCMSSVLVSAQQFSTMTDRHFVTTELGVGYSGIFHTSDLGKTNGLAGGALQVGYEWKHRRFLLHSGLEFASVNSTASIHPFELTADYTQGLTTGKMTEHFRFSDFGEKEYLGQVNIPIMAGGVFDDRYYFLAGVKLGIPVYALSGNKAFVRTTLSDDHLIGELGDIQDVPVHDVLSFSAASSHTAKTAFNAQASAEVGLMINGFLPQKKGRTAPAVRRGEKQPLPRLYRVGLFCDYGFTSCIRSAEQPVSEMASATAPRDVSLNSYLATSGRFSSLLVGVKFAVLFQVNRPKQPAKPQSWLDVDVVDAATHKPLSSQVEVRNLEKSKVVVRTAKKGKVHARTNLGNYSVTARATDYYSDTQFYSLDSLGENISLSFALRHRPYFRFSVKNADTDAPLAVSAEFINAATNDTVLRLNTDELGNAKRMLEDSVPYRIRIAHAGYETFIADVASIADSMTIALVPIKQGRKIVVEHLYFATNEVTILPESDNTLDELALFLAENPTLRIRVIGHTDNVGSDRDNQVLSEGRANSVKNALVERGVAAERIETAGMGRTQPIATNDTEEGRAKNRRVEYTIISE